MPGQPHGLRVWYGDGTVQGQRVTPGDLAALSLAWADLPGDDVQYVAVFYTATYAIVKADGYDERGYPINQRTVQERYVDTLSGVDYYWLDPTTGEPTGSNRVREIPEGVIVKRGRELPVEAWRSLIDRAQADRTGP